MAARWRGGWAGGGRGAASNNCVWVPANMRRLPARPAARRGSRQQLSRSSRMPRAKVGSGGAGRSPRAGGWGLRGFTLDQGAWLCLFLWLHYLLFPVGSPWEK